MEASNPEKVIAALRASPSEWLCDDCVTHLSGIPNRQAVHPITTTLGLTTDFSREKHECSRCREIKLVTRPV